MNVLLINPPAEFLKIEGHQSLPPMGLLYIGACLEKEGHHVKIVDCVAHNYDHPQYLIKNKEKIIRLDVPKGYWETLFKEFKPDFIGISNLFSCGEAICKELSKKLKALQPKAKIVLGGTNASVRAEYLLQDYNIDFVVIGEGEEITSKFLKVYEKSKTYDSLPGLAYRKGGKIVRNRGGNWIENLDNLPLPGYHLLQNSMENYFQEGLFGGFSLNKRLCTVGTSRGCMLNCIFCSGKNNFGRLRVRSPENVIKEIEYMINKYNVKEIAFIDSNINFYIDRFEKIIQLMKERNFNINWTPFGGIYVKSFDKRLLKIMKETGCHSICLAVEHGDSRMQEYIGKIVPLEKVQEIVIESEKLGIWTHGYFVLGLPGETKESLNQCINYAKKANFDSIGFTIGTPLPGSCLYEQVKEKYHINIDELNFYSKRVRWTEMEYSYLRKKLKVFMLHYIIFKICQNLAPKSIWLHIRSLKTEKAKIYKRALQRFLKNFLLR